MISAARFRLLIGMALLLGPVAWAGPFIPAGDLALRHDIQRLADAGIIKGPTTTWPLAWGPIMDDLQQADASSLHPAIVSSLIRVRDRANWETRTTEITFKAKVGGAENPTRIRSFQDTPRGEIEIAAGASWIDDWFSIELNLQGVDSDQDSKELRFDDSMIGVMVGNWSFAASTQQRWWGPGWDGSLILSNNARPIPSLTIDRVFTDAFESKWLSWIGPWDLSVMFGQMETERHLPNTKFFGMRVNFRPIPSLEFGLSRSAQWCGDGRPCDADTFLKLLLGQDNRGGGGIDLDNEPGNQLAGVDFRWSPGFFGHTFATYGQFIGEDEAGGFPSRYLVHFGIEGSGLIRDQWSYRWYAELAGTSCDFVKDDIYNCAYNHFIYQTGYRFRSRAIGHGADNDSRLISVGTIIVNAEDTQWRALIRYGELNRGGPPDSRNSLTPTRQDIASFDVFHSRVFSFGVIDVGVGYEKVDDFATGVTYSDGRFYLQWRSAF
ncbi:MAG: capsule assembly Wzi family protein [Proteobacteria bacterium]|nr:capsule assembly Wzi family protein [Pseudomonadota bacterium]